MMTILISTHIKKNLRNKEMVKEGFVEKLKQNAETSDQGMAIKVNK
jgi:hypothetical protein